MSIAILPILAALAANGAEATAAERAAEQARMAQVQLAEALASADSIDSIAVTPAAGARPITIAFAIEVHGEAFVLSATTASTGAITALAVADRGAARDAERGALSWLAPELDDAVAITSLIARADGRVVMATSDGRTYLALPMRGRDGNTAVEARWAAAWES
jgi:hypothetical protein